MDKKEMEQYVDELYAIHKDISDIHRESMDRLINLTKDNRATIEKSQQIKKEIVEAVVGIKIYCNWFIILIVTAMIGVVLMFSWKFYSFNNNLNSKLLFVYDRFEKVAEIKQEQERLSKWIEEIESNQSKIGAVKKSEINSSKE